MYRVTINTDNYKAMIADKKHWERGTVNDYIHAINGWTANERGLQEIRWRLAGIIGYAMPKAWDDAKNTWKTAYKRWNTRRINRVKYHDNICGFDREEPIHIPGMPQGYIDIYKVINEVKSSGSARICFDDAFDIRQGNSRVFRGCYIEITKV